MMGGTASNMRQQRVTERNRFSVSEVAVAHHLHRFFRISATYDRCNLFPCQPAQEAQPEYQAGLIVIDRKYERIYFFLTGFDPCLRLHDTRFHVYDFSSKVANLVFVAGRVRHTGYDCRTGESRVAQGLQRFSRPREFVDQLKVLV